MKQLGDEDFLKISKQLMKQLDEKDLKKVKQMMKEADEIADEVGEKKFKEVLEKAEGGGKIVGKDRIVSIIKNIRFKSPEQLIEDGWEEVTNPKMAANTTSRELYNPKSGLKIRFDKGLDGANGFEAVDHYHVMNPNYTNKKVDYYLDINGNPVGKGSKESHIIIKGEE